MTFFNNSLRAGACLAVFLPAFAFAQDDFGEGEEEAKRDRVGISDLERDTDIREIERGYYVRSSLGGAMYLLNVSQVLYPGMSSGVTFGQDFVDREKTSMAWEISFTTATHNGLQAYDQDQSVVTQATLYDEGLLPRNALTQGDSRTFNIIGSYEFSGYPGRRFGLGVRADAGIMLMPLLIPAEYYDSVILPGWGETVSPNHRKVYPVFGLGPTFEYYTKLSHFSVGADAIITYAVGLDLGANFGGYLKYTF